MLIGVPKETTQDEYRVGLTPDNVRELKSNGHSVYIEKSAGVGSGFSDKAYTKAGAGLVSYEQVFSQSELIVKVKEPSIIECEMMHGGQTLFTFLHLAANKPLIQALLDSNVTAIAYENVVKDSLDNNFPTNFPLLTPMSIIAGRMAVQVGAHYLEKTSGGKGILLGGAQFLEEETPANKGLSSSIPSANVVIIGGGTAGTAALSLALGYNTSVKLFDNNEDVVSRRSNVHTLLKAYHVNELREHLYDADLVIGAVMNPGRKAPIILTKDDIKKLSPGTVFVDISIDQGGCSETSRRTTHELPVYGHEDVIHYGVPNIPGVVPRTSTYALTAVTFPYVKLLADLQENELARLDDLKPAISIRRGEIVDERLEE